MSIVADGDTCFIIQFRHFLTRQDFITTHCISIPENNSPSLNLLCSFCSNGKYFSYNFEWKKKCMFTRWKRFYFRCRSFVERIKNQRKKSQYEPMEKNTFFLYFNLIIEFIRIFFLFLGNQKIFFSKFTCIPRTILP